MSPCSFLYEKVICGWDRKNLFRHFVIAICSDFADFKNFLRAGIFKNNFLTVTVVPTFLEDGLIFAILPPVTDNSEASQDFFFDFILRC